MGRPKDETFWQHVLKEDGGRRCEFCGKRWKGKPSISRLKSHFAGVKNQGIEICEHVPEHVQRAALDAINVSETVKEAALEEIQRKIHERRNKKISSSTTLEDNQMTLVHPNNELANQESDRLMAMETTITDEDFLDFGASTLPDVPNENNVRESVQVIETVGDKLITKELVGIQFEIDCRKIQDWLLDDEVSMIGIHGMPGSGKTELAKHINNNLINASKFHHVCWVTVSPNFSIYKLQDAIAKAVGGVDLSNVDDENIRAARLSKALGKGKQRHVIILDDVWDYIPLKGIGIFAGIGTCKLILTTCLLDVCDKMQCQEIIKVQPLNYCDVKDLIHSEIRDELPESTIEQLLEISGGLPLGIVMMIRNIRGKVEAYEQKIMLDNWEGGTLSLESKEVFSRLRRCYDKLDPTLQQCFLYCALLRNWRIEENDLISYLIDEGIINTKEGRKKKFEEGYYMLGRLKNCCLLLGGNRIKMHTLFWHMALKINESSMAMVGDYRELIRLLEEERCPVDIKRILLVSDCIKQIPKNYSPSWPNLLTLLLCNSACLESIPCSFFMKLQGLKCLNLSYNFGIKELPDSISHLVSLRALLLRSCHQLRKVPSLTELKALRKLDLSDSGIEEVPKGLELSKLEYLGLMGTKLKVLPLEILDKLCCLEVLIIDYHLLRINAKEIANLRMLETLISRCDNYDEFVAFLEGIRLLQCRYQLYVSRHLYHEESFLDEEYLSFDKRVAIYDSRLSGEEQVIFPLKTIECLQLFRCQGGRIFSLEKATHLQSLSIHGCKSLESFLFLSKPLGIHFQDCILKVLELSDCPSLKKLFPYWLHLQNLSKLSVSDCDNLEEIISVMEEETLESTILSDVYFESLCHIQLLNLPKLKSIWRGNLNVESLQSLEVVNCRELERMPLNLVHKHDNPSLLSSLAHATFYPKEWFDKVQWVHPSTHSVLSPISRFHSLEEDDHIYSDNDSYF